MQLATITVDTNTAAHTLFGNRMGARKDYNPKNKGKKSYQTILSFLAETREYTAEAPRTWTPWRRALPSTVKRVHPRIMSPYSSMD